MLCKVRFKYRFNRSGHERETLYPFIHQPRRNPCDLCAAAIPNSDFDKV
jgi:hypothetical protein